MNTEIVVAKPNALAHVAGSQQLIEAKDIDIANIYVVQSNSSAALERDIPAGSLAGAGGSTVYCKPKQVFEFVPLSFRRVWDIYKLAGPDKATWLEQTPYTPDNSNAPWDWTEHGETYTRKQKLHIICMDKAALKAEANFMKQIAAGKVPSLDDFSFPVCISIKGASMKTAGKVLFTHIAKVDSYNALAPEGMQKPHYCRYLKASTVLETKDNNKFFVVKFEAGDMCSPEELTVLAKWAKVMQTSNVRIEDTEIGEPEDVGF